MRSHELIERAEKGEVIGDGSEQIRALSESLQNVEKWHSKCWEVLRAHLRSHASPSLYDECIVIMETGKSRED